MVWEMVRCGGYVEFKSQCSIIQWIKLGIGMGISWSTTQRMLEEGADYY